MFRRVLLVVILLQIFEVSTCFALNNKEWDYRSKVYQDEARVRYEKKLLPKSGYMTVEQYERESAAKDKSQGDGDFIPKVQDSKMKYVPQPYYKLVRYNNPPGTVELKIDRKVRYDRQQILPGLISADVTMMIVPIISYYSKTKSTDCDVYILPLRKGLPDVEKVVRANIAAKLPTPIFSTDRTLIEYGTFRTITPIDFSADLAKVLAKEKVGNAEDGIWQTEALVYDILTKKQTRLSEIREAIRYYWITTKNLDLRDIRWDIYPLGFDIKNPNRILVSAYAYAGFPPRCLGIWSIDTNGTQSRLESLSDENVQVSTIGLKIVKDGVVDPESVVAEAKLAEKYEKEEAKNAKKRDKEVKKKLKQQYKEEIKQIKTDYKQLKKEDSQEVTDEAKFHKYIPFYKIKGGKPTAFDKL